MVLFSSIRLGVARDAKHDLGVISSNSLRKSYKSAQRYIARVFQLRFRKPGLHDNFFGTVPG